MTTAYTALLGLALPVTGELQGQWGITVNDSITSLLDTAVSGTTTLSTDSDVTLTTTAGTANQARQAILLCSGARTALRTITAPAQSKIYTIINATTGGYAVKLVGAGPTTGLTIPNGASAVVAWNGSDFIEVGSSTVGNLTVNGNLSVTGNTTLGDAAGDTLTINAGTTTLTQGTANQVQYLNGSKVLSGSANLTFDGTTLTAGGLSTAGSVTLSGGTANGVLYLNGSKAATSGSALTFDGTNLGVGANPTSYVSKIATNGNLSLAQAGKLYLWDATDSSGTYIYNANNSSIAFGIYGGSEGMRLTSTGLGIGTSSPATKLHVNKSSQTPGDTTPSGALLVTNTAAGAAGVEIGSGSPVLGYLQVRNTSNQTYYDFALQPNGGNVGIGTSSPGAKLQVGDAGSTAPVKILIRSASADTYLQSTSSGSVVGTPNGVPLIFNTNDAEKMRLDSSGNLGLGVTPSAWSGTTSVFQNPSGSIYSFAANYQNGFNANAYWNGSNWIYRNTAAASDYFQQNGSHVWRNATSGTAGNAISFTQAMTLDASGNLLLGTTNVGAAGISINNVYNYSLTEGSNSSFVNLFRQTSSAATILANGYKRSATVNGFASSYGSSWAKSAISLNFGNIIFYTDTAATTAVGTDVTPTPRVTLDSSGNLLVGTTDSAINASPGIKLNPAQSGANAPTLAVVTSASTNTTVSYSAYSTGAAAYRFYVDNAGTIFATNTTISAISDQRLKENIQDLDAGLDKIMSLKPRKFDWKAGKGKDIKGDRGFIAQEFEQVFPDLIDEWKDPAPEGEDPYKSVRADLIPVLVKAVQEQHALITDLRARVAQLEAKG